MKYTYTYEEMKLEVINGCRCKYTLDKHSGLYIRETSTDCLKKPKS